MNALALPQGFRPPALPTALFIYGTAAKRLPSLPGLQIVTAPSDLRGAMWDFPDPVPLPASRATSLDRDVRGGVNVPPSLRLGLFHEDGPRCSQTVPVRGQMCAGPAPRVEIAVVLPSSPKDSSLGETLISWVFPHFCSNSS